MTTEPETLRAYEKCRIPHPLKNNPGICQHVQPKSVGGSTGDNCHTFKAFIELGLLLPRYPAVPVDRRRHAHISTARDRASQRELGPRFTQRAPVEHEALQTDNERIETDPTEQHLVETDKTSALKRVEGLEPCRTQSDHVERVMFKIPATRAPVDLKAPESSIGCEDMSLACAATQSVTGRDRGASTLMAAQTPLSIGARNARTRFAVANASAIYA